MPVTMPDTEPIVAMLVAPEVQKPPGTASLHVAVVPIHTTLAPVIGVGAGLTVTGIVAIHPLSGVV